MGYKVKWVQDNLGVSRKALRVFEQEGVMPKNQNGQDRDYTDEDIDLIWRIRLFQGMGYSLKEIAVIARNEWIDIQKSITEKIEELQKKKADIERYLRYAEMIKLTGEIPSRPKEMGSTNSPQLK